MSTVTSNYGLVKPTKATDYVDVDQMNANMDLIDAKLKAMETYVKTARIGKFVNRTLDAAQYSPGQNYIDTTPQFQVDGKRALRLNVKWDGMANAAGGSGHWVYFERSFNGGAWAQVPGVEGMAVVYEATTYYITHTLECFDTSNTQSGLVQYRLNFAGYLMNGDNILNIMFTIWDAGAISDGSLTWNDFPITTTWDNIDPAFTWNTI